MVCKNNLEWKGRIDSETDKSQFRFHQVVNLMDVKDLVYQKEKAFCFLGFECDEGVRRNKGRVGAKEGPNDIRKSLSHLPFNFEKNIKVFDAKNVTVDGSDDFEEGQKKLSKKIEIVLNNNMFPIVFGGGHSVAYGSYNGLKNYIKENKLNKKIGIINFDADFDNRDYSEQTSSGTMFKQIYDDCMKNGDEFHYLTLGVQKYRNTVKLFNTAKETNTKYILGKDFNNDNYEYITHKINSFAKNVDYLYITICMDVFSSSFVPGVSAPQPLGISPFFALKVLAYIIRHYNVKILDFAEFAPNYDVEHMTSRLIAQLTYNIIEYLIEK